MSKIVYLSSQYLIELYEKRKEKNPNYSMRAFARDLGLVSSQVSSLFMHKSSVTPKTARKISEKLDLPQSEKLKFLTAAQQDATSKRQAKIVDNDFMQISEITTQVISDWRHLAIFALVRADNFNPDPDWIADQLNFPKDVVQACLDRLLAVGLIKQTKKTFEPNHLNVTTSADVPAESIKQLLIQQIKLAEAAVRDVPVDLRNLSCVSMPFDLNHYEDAVKMIDGFRRRFIKRFLKGKKESVYNLNIQFVPITNIKHLVAKKAR